MGDWKSKYKKKPHKSGRKSGGFFGKRKGGRRKSFKLFGIKIF